jgi:hypothetical protein
VLDCQELEVCSEGQLSCETVVRQRGTEIVSVSKGCKQTEACVNSGTKNPVNFWTSPSCNPAGDGESVGYFYYFEKFTFFKIERLFF